MRCLHRKVDLHVMGVQIPGCSSELALFYENGPFKIEKNSSLVWNEYGWDQFGDDGGKNAVQMYGGLASIASGALVEDRKTSQQHCYILVSANGGLNQQQVDLQDLLDLI